MKSNYHFSSTSRLIKQFTFLIALASLPCTVVSAAICKEGYESASFNNTNYTQFGSIAGGTSSLAKPILEGKNSLIVALSNNGDSPAIQTSDNGFQINQNMQNSVLSNIATFTFGQPISNFKVNIFDIVRVQLGEAIEHDLAIKSK
ncbi:MAG: hypothetical protein Q4P13_02990, partial [Psychrobacter sp.]|nr:hypothetical protein [Psychrobacter sp.]